MRNIITQEHILNAIQSKIQGGATYMDAIIDYAEINGIEIESIGEVIKRSQIIKEKIKIEAVNLSMLKTE